MSWLDHANATVAGICLLLFGMVRMISLVNLLRHELNSKLDEMMAQSRMLGKMEGAEEQRETSRLIAKELLEKNESKPPTVHTDSLGP